MIEWRIIARKMAGISTTAEDKLFDQWISEEPSHIDYYNRMLKEFENPSSIQMTKEEIDQFIKKFDDFVLAEENRSERIARRRKYLLRAAAVWVGLLLIGVSAIYIYKAMSSATLVPEVQVAEAVKPGEAKANITLSNGDVLTLDGAGDMLYMDGRSGVVITKRGGLISYKHDEKNAGTPEAIYNTIAVPVGGEYTLELSDGSKIWLNAKTILHFPVRFSGNHRTVDLDGEAYFEIMYKAHAPFMVHTPSSDIKVYGTKFNVSAYNGEAVHTTTLCEGSVSITAADKKEIFLKPGEQAVLINAGEIAVKEVNSEAHASWHSGSFVFENENLDRIMNQLSKWYGVQVVFLDESLKGLHFTGDLPRDRNLNEILNLIQMTRKEIVFEIRHNTLFVKWKSDNQ